MTITGWRGITGLGVFAILMTLFAAYKVEGQSDRDMESAGQELLELMGESLADATGCDWPLIVGNNIVLVVSIRAAGQNVFPGDKIISIDGVDVESGEELRKVLSEVSENGEILLGIHRDGKTTRVSLRCDSSSEKAALYVRFLKAMAEGDASECVRRLEDLRRQHGRFFLTEIYGDLCIQRAHPQEFSENYDSILYEKVRLTIEQTKFDPSLFEQYRGHVIAGIEMLESRNSHRYANDLESVYMRAQAFVNGERSAADENNVIGTGTCFVVSPNGLALTNAHVVGGGSQLLVTTSDSKKQRARILVKSESNDLALLKIERSGLEYISLSMPRTAETGAEVFTLGFPVSPILGGEPKFTDGVISSVSGIGGEASRLQITVPIQPGNSGGPLVSHRGEVLGIVSSSAREDTFMAASGSLPQNVNWAIKSDYAMLMFDQPQRLPLTASREEAIERTAKAICMVEVIE